MSDERDAKELEGTPDLVVEVVSTSSVRKDTQLLRRAYHAAGIGEYWLVDARGDAIVFQVLRWSARDYESSSADADGWTASPLFRRRFRLEREHDRLGHWRYTLNVAHLPVE